MQKEEATRESPAIPKMTIISKPFDCIDSNKNKHDEGSMNLLIRMMSMQKPHKALALTGAVCTTTASKIEGSLVKEVSKISKDSIFTMAHPGGLLQTFYSVDKDGAIDFVRVKRTARRIMKGVTFVKHSY